MAILDESVGLKPVLASWSHFALFVGHYTRGDLVQARYHAIQLTNETYVYGQLARALIARSDGDDAETQRAVQAIRALQPTWGDDPRREIGNLIKPHSIADRLPKHLLATR